VPTVHAFFDFDDTLCSGDSILYWLRFYYRKRPARRVFQLANGIGLLAFALRLLDSHALKRVFLWPMAFESPGELDRLAAEFVAADLAARLHAPVLRRLWTHHLLGHKVVILSASATFYLKHLKSFLPMADIQGSELIWPERPWRLPRYRDGNLRGENKLKRMRELGYGEGARALSFAYSDHFHDRFLLGFSEFPICVRPERRLRRLAAEKGWPVLDWDEPGRPPRWRVLLGKLGLLLFAAGPGLPPTGSDPLKEAAQAREYAPGQVRALRERVAAKHPEGDPAFAAIFGEPGRRADQNRQPSTNP
jgi:HAD superfamily phosphoserine phosphatase-like hydrolase